MSDLYEAVEREVVELHTFFEDWFTGRLPDRDDAFERVEQVLSPRFVLVIPEGRIIRRAELISSLRNRHGARSEALDESTSDDFDIWIDSIEIQIEDGDLVVATYEEWQRIEPEDGETEEKGRISSVVFTRNDDMPHGLGWQHLHETWLHHF
jgi:hypothetical protein